jgi:hypothetical protein
MIDKGRQVNHDAGYARLVLSGSFFAFLVLLVAFVVIALARFLTGARAKRSIRRGELVFEKLRGRIPFLGRG